MLDLNPVEAVLLVVFFAVPVAGIVDAARIPASAWEAAGSSKRLWIAVQALTLYLGAVVYFVGVRRDVLFFTVPPSEDFRVEEPADDLRTEE